MPFGTLHSARNALNYLRSNATVTIDDLLLIANNCDSTLQAILEREQLVLDRSRPSPFIDRAIDFSAWIIAIAGFSASVADFYAEGSLSLWGWVGLVIGWIGLALGATAYQRRTWTRDHCAAELAEISECKIVISDVMDETERRLTFV
jgi:hypothetical protein